MDLLIGELTGGIQDAAALTRVLIRLLAASFFGAIVGFQRERTHKAAGLRTHMLVCLGAALFVLLPAEAGMSASDVSRIIQGVAAGIGFLGAGAIIKLEADREIHGLTTAAGIWTTAAVGVAVGTGRIGIAALGVALAWIILAVMARLDVRGR